MLEGDERRQRPAREQKMRDAPISLAFLGGTVGAVDRAELRRLGLVFGIAVDGAEAARVARREIARTHRAEMQKIEMRGVDVALEPLQPIAITQHEGDLGLILRNMR